MILWYIYDVLNNLCFTSNFLSGLLQIDIFLTLFAGSSQNIRFLEVFLAGGGTNRMKVKIDVSDIGLG